MKIVDLSVFDADERTVINNMVANETMNHYGRSDLLANLTFSRSISTDQDMMDLLDGLLEKVKALTDAEWDEMKLMLPLNVPYDTAEVLELEDVI